MIVYDLQCECEHAFEGWFASSEAYEAQRTAGDLACPHCGSTKIEKALMAPAVRGGRGRGRQASPDKQETANAATNAGQAAEVRKALKALRKAVEASGDDVGAAFPEEARKIHYGEAEARNIYGQASDEDAAELDEEGVPFARIPWLDDEH